jgi:hypothetical protein
MFAILQARAALLEIFQQLVDRGAQLAQDAGLAFERHATGGAAVAREIRELIGEIADRAFLALLPRQKHDQAHGQNCRGNQPQHQGRQDQP